MSIKKEDVIELLVQVRPNLPDELALKFQKMYPHWKEGIAITQKMIDEGKNRFLYEDVLYTALLPHTTADNWKPTIAPSLFAKVLIPDDTQIYPWEQPESTNPYGEGDVVSHNGKVWVSKHPANIWEPGAVGTEDLWVEVV